jgi:hypothetical protein
MKNYSLIILLLLNWSCSKNNDSHNTINLIQAFNNASRAADYQAADSLSHELIRSRNASEIIAVWDTTGDIQQKEDLIEILYKIEAEPQVSAFFHELSTQPISSDSYYGNMYLAKSGDLIALHNLDSLFWKWPVTSWQLSYTVKLFGDHLFRPAIPNLIEAIDAASLNLSGEACESLVKLYPDSPKFASPGEAKEYYIKRYKQSQ